MRQKNPLTTTFVLFILISLGKLNASCPNSPNPNLIYNGDFGSGSDNVNINPIINFSSPLTYNFTPFPTTGRFNLINNTTNIFSNWIDIGDNSTDPNGYMMLVNGYVSPAVNYSYTLEVCEGLDYYFSVDVINMAKSSSTLNSGPTLELRINGVAISPSLMLPKDENWYTLEGSYTVPAGVSSIDIELYNYSGVVIGNDFAIDNVKAQLCGPEVILSEQSSGPYCPGDNVFIETTLSTNLPGITYYQAQLSIDNGQTWYDAGPVQNTSLINLANIPYNSLARVLVSNSPTLITTASCAYQSEPFIISFENISDCYSTPVNSPGVACQGDLGNNFFNNGNFGTGSTLFGNPLNINSTEFNYSNLGTIQEGGYSIVNTWSSSPCDNDPTDICWIQDIEDSAGNTNGYFMIANGGDQTEILWSKDVLGLCENNIHVISFDAMNLAFNLYAPNNNLSTDSVALPELELVISDLNAASELIRVIPTSFTTGPILNDGNWNNFSFSFISDNFQNDVKVSLRLKGNTRQGNDIALDNISLSFCGPSIDIEGPDFACENENIQLEAAISNALTNNFFFNWQKSTDAGNTWLSIPGGNSAILNLAATIGEQYRVQVAYNEFSGFPDINCFAVSESFVVDVYDAGPYPLVAEICEGDYFYVGTDSFSIDINTQITLTSYQGCDSIVDLSLTVLEDPVKAITQNICPGDTFEFGGETISENGIYFDTLVSYQGCDSTLILSLIVLDTSIIEEEVNLCVGDTFEGMSFENDTIIERIYTNILGCDSTIIYNINVSELEDFEIMGKKRLCDGDFPSTEVSVDQFESYLWSNGTQTRVNTITIPGTYSVTVTDDLGCEEDQIFDIPLISLDMNIDITPPLCHDAATGTIEFSEVTGGDEPYIYSITGGIFTSPLNMFENVAPQDDSITVYLADSNDCFIVENIFMPNPDSLFLDLGEDQVINIGESVTISASSNQDITTIEWTPADSVDCANCLTVNLEPEITQTLTAVISNEVGCEATDRVKVEIGKIRKVYIPNVFSPDADGQNEIFFINGGLDVEKLSDFQINDRWGNTCHFVKELQPNIPLFGWDGKREGKICPAGVYSYQFYAYFTDGVVRIYEGSITLLR